mmetsp:Transcript_115312/g.200074  ORF Transcript_115312/g.200074 Transcript_115312/m.200074 type:complete len:206 (-) Transcript_115312:47-664(-)
MRPHRSHLLDRPPCRRMHAPKLYASMPKLGALLCPHEISRKLLEAQGLSQCHRHCDRRPQETGGRTTLFSVDERRPWKATSLPTDLTLHHQIDRRESVGEMHDNPLDRCPAPPPPRSSVASAKGNLQSQLYMPDARPPNLQSLSCAHRVGRNTTKLQPCAPQRALPLGREHLCAALHLSDLAALHVELLRSPRAAKNAPAPARFA